MRTLRSSPRSALLSFLTLATLLALAACAGPSSNPPVADAGADVQARVGQEVRLDGSGSTDSAGSSSTGAGAMALSYAWTFLSRPSSSSATLRDADTATPAFTPDVVGPYDVQLTVSHGGSRATDSVLVTVAAALDPPTADAGDDQVVAVGGVAQVDGRASTGPEPGELTFSWRFVSKPTGSVAALNDASSRTPRFTADKAGGYVLELSVSDGASTATDMVSVRANRPPVADAGVDQDGRVGQPVFLDGSRSADPDRDALHYAWTFINVPTGSAAALQAADTPSASFTPDVEGAYVLELTVDDTMAQASNRVTVNVVGAGGVLGTVLYVATTGNDTNPGSQTQPFQTLGAALDAAAGNAAITRVELAAGTYDGESFDYDVATDLQIVGSSDPLAPSTLSATGDLLKISGSASVSLVRLTLRTDGVAVEVAKNASASLVKLDCQADVCVRSGFLFVGGGGTVSITGSTFTAAAAGGSVGASGFAGDSMIITGTTIEGFDNGVTAWGTPLTLIDATLTGNGFGLNVIGSDTDTGAFVSGGTIDNNDVGIQATAAKNLTIRDTVITENVSTGMVIESGGAIVLDGVTIGENDHEGLVIEETSSDGAVVTVRDSYFTQNQGSAVQVFGEDSHLDLGSSSEPGNNVLSSYFRWGLEDLRPSGATGFIVMSSTSLNGKVLTPDRYHGPLEKGDAHDGWLKILNDTEVIVN